MMYMMYICMNYGMFGLRLAPLQETRNGPMSGELRMDVGSFISCTKNAKEHGFGVSEWTAPFSPRPVLTMLTCIEVAIQGAGNRLETKLRNQDCLDQTHACQHQNRSEKAVHKVVSRKHPCALHSNLIEIIRIQSKTCLS